MLENVIHRVKPELHVFGHVHHCHGLTKIQECETIFANTAICLKNHHDVNDLSKPYLFEFV